MVSEVWQMATVHDVLQKKTCYDTLACFATFFGLSLTKSRLFLLVACWVIEHALSAADFFLKFSESTFSKTISGI